MPRDISLSDSKCWNGGQKLVNGWDEVADCVEEAAEFSQNNKDFFFSRILSAVSFPQ